MTEAVKIELIRIINKYMPQITEEEKDELMYDIDRTIRDIPEEAQFDMVHYIEQRIKTKIQTDIENSRKKKKEFKSTIIELYTWLFIGFFSSFIIWRDDFENYSRILFIFSFIFLPYIFKLIFSRLPFDYLYNKFSNKPKNYDYILESLLNPDLPVKIQMLLLQCIYESKSRAERLFSHSRAYLMLGCLISILGVGIFIFLNDSTSIKDFSDALLVNNNILNILSLKMLEILPRFGILFFIEYIAFFFLKQYRILMEEYRYYESIKRKRQDLLVAYLSINELTDKKDALNMFLNYMDKHSAVVPQITGTHKLKTEKMVYDDLDFISKVTSLVQAVKSNEKTKGD